MDNFITPPFLTSYRENFIPTVKSHIDHFTPRWGGVSLNDFDASIEKQATAIAPCGHGAIDWTMKSKLSIREQTEATKYQTKNRAQMFNLFPKRLMSLQRAATYVKI